MDLRLIAKQAGLSISTVAEEETFQDALALLVEKGRMRPSEGLELYCERHSIPVDAILMFAEEELDLSAYVLVTKAIDKAFNKQDISDWFPVLAKHAEALSEYRKEGPAT